MNPAAQCLFEVLVEAACAGARCPSNDQLPHRARLGGLCRAGLIRCEIYEKNWRVVEIRHGEHAGKRTAEHPGGRKPYRIVDDKGDRWVTRAAGTGAPAMRHVARQADGHAGGAAPVTLPKLSFLDNGEKDIT